jgi:hypothetical protein
MWTNSQRSAVAHKTVPTQVLPKTILKYLGGLWTPRDIPPMRWLCAHTLTWKIFNIPILGHQHERQIKGNVPKSMHVSSIWFSFVLRQGFVM